MVRLVSLVASVLLLGCATRSAMLAPPNTSFRQSATELAPELMVKALQNEGWVIEVLDRSKRGQTALNSTEEWDQTTLWIVFNAKNAEGVQQILTPEQSKPVLKGLRSDLRKMIAALGGEVQEIVEAEAFKERTLLMTYRLDQVSGGILMKLSPASGDAEERNNKLEVTIREQN